MSELLLALDFGGTKLAAAIAEIGAPDWLARDRCLSPAHSNADSDRRLMRELSDRLLAGRQPRAIGVSFGGPTDARRGLVRLSHHVPGWEQVPLQAELEADYGAPARIDNDANVAALGEARYGAGRGVRDLCYLTVSTGVGSGWILNGQPWQGWQGLAGEIGHTVVDPAGPLCLCGKRGCLERFASGPYLACAWREQLQAQPELPAIARRLIGDDWDAISGATVNQAAIAGEPLAQAVLQRAGWALGVAMGNAANLLNPQLFVLGGGVSQAGAWLHEPLQAAARATALPEVEFEIVPAALGDTAPLWGARALAAQAIGASETAR